MSKQFTLQDGKTLEITETAINHIADGDLVIRPMQNKKNMLVLSGGLHTYEGWVTLKNEYADELSHLYYFNSRRHSYWYYARTLSNGVITLRIPRDLFTGKAAKITMYPDDYYVSGYLWKTLFPEGYTKEKILAAIEEALENEDISQRSKGKVIGYINNDSPLLRIELTIQYRRKQIKSVFPSWGQPNTGNNGKPYSHYDNIGFIIAQSTEYFDDTTEVHASKTSTCPRREISTEELSRRTPELFTSRVNPKPNEPPGEWAKARQKEISDFTTSESESNKVFEYLNDFHFVKYYPDLTNWAYTHSFEDLQKSGIFYNTFQIVQNFSDGLDYLHLSKQYKQLTETIIFILKNMVTHTPFDFFSKKKILSAIMRIVSAAKNPELSYFFIESLSTSPIRREAYLDYNIDSLSKKRLTTPIDHFPEQLALVGNPAIDINITYKDFIEILKEVLGETYTLNFDSDQLNNILKGIIDGQSENFQDLIKDGLSFFSRQDLASLSENIDDILLCASKYANGEKELLAQYAGLILRDYCRIQFAHRQRINSRYINFHNFTDEIYSPIDQNLLFGIILKHERWRNSYRTEKFIKGIMRFSNYTSDHKLKNDATNFIKKIGNEAPPLPRR